MVKNIIANILGRFWGILSNYLFIPFYISILGIEGYSIISFSLIIIGIMGVLDSGLTSTLSREFAKHNVGNKLNTLNTLELCYWVIGIIALISVCVGAKTIAENWLTLTPENVDYVANSLRVFSVVMAFQLLGNFYLGGLLGLEMQIRANVYQACWGLLKNGFVVVVISFKPSLIYFFSWQALITIFYVLILRRNLIKFLDRSGGTKFTFHKSLLSRSWKFAGGMLLISVVAAINTQLDKIAISKMLPIEELGFYQIGITLTQVLLVLVAPISVALLPRFTSLYSMGKNENANKLYYEVAGGVSVLVFSVGAVLIFFSKDVIFLWTGNNELAIATSKYILYLMLGTAMLAIQVVPFNIAIANGYTKINNILGIASLFVSIPGYLFAVHYYGTLGAAVTWCLLQTITTPIYLFYIHKRFLYGHSFLLLIKQTYIPAFAAIIVAYLFAKVVPSFDHKILSVTILGCVTVLTLLAVTIISIPRNRLVLYWLSVKQKLVSENSLNL